MTRMVGRRIALREYCWDDLSLLRLWATDPETTRWLGQGFLRPQTFEHTEQYLRSVLEGDAGGINFAIADLDSDRYIGQINLLRIDSQARHAELAMVLCPDRQGRGYGREAIALMLDCAFGTWNLNRVYLSVDADNQRAVACYRAAGFRVEGRLRQDRYWGGRYHDTLLMGILREEWLLKTKERGDV